jgi:hypothetical protein
LVGRGIGFCWNREQVAARIVGLALATMVLFGQPAAGQKARAAVPARSPHRSVDAAGLDVADIRLGMTAERAVAAAAASSYRCKRGSSMATFEERAAAEVARRKGQPPVMFGPSSGIGQIECVGPVGESLRLDFAPAPEASVVQNLVLLVNAARADVAALKRQALAKYGDPTSATPNKDLWCHPEAGPPTSLFWCARGTPFLSEDTIGGNFEIILSAGV